MYSSDWEPQEYDEELDYLITEGEPRARCERCGTVESHFDEINEMYFCDCEAEILASLPIENFVLYDARQKVFV